VGGSTVPNLVTNSVSNSTSVEQMAAVAAVLAGFGVPPGERVLIMLPDGPGFDFGGGG
jgi:acyl-CoA synthetase (AMP-forming)/AMP-acid ligase II